MNVWDTFLISGQIQSAIQINTVLCLLEKLPFFPKKINCSNYKLKSKLTFLSFGVDIISRIFFSVIAVILGIVIPFLIIEDYFPAYNENRLNLFYKLFLLLFLGMGSLTNTSFSNPNEQRYICTKRFYIDPKGYFFYDFIVTHFWNILGSVPVYIILMMKYRIFTWWILPLTITKEIFGIVGEYCYIRFCERSKITFKPNSVRNVLFKSLFVLACIGLIYLKNVIFTNIILLAAIIIPLLLSLYAFIRLSRYPNFMKVFLAVDKANDFALDLQTEEHEAAIKNVKGIEENTSDADEAPYMWLSGLFIDRILGSYKKRIKYIWLAAVILMLACIGFILYDAEKAAEYGRLAVRFCWVPSLFSFSLCGNKNMIKLMFFECDSSLLRYRFYREKDAMIKTFASRLIAITELNLKTTLPIASVMLFIAVYVKASVLSTICAVLPVFLTAVFSAVHYLFLYYYLQPFSTETSVIKPSYTITERALNLLLASLMIIQNHILPVILVFVIIAVYAAISISLIVRHGERTFRLW